MIERTTFFHNLKTPLPNAGEPLGRTLKTKGLLPRISSPAKHDSLPPIRFQGRTISLVADTRYPSAESYQQRIFFQACLENLHFYQSTEEKAYLMAAMRALIPDLSSQTIHEPVQLLSESHIQANTLGEHALFMMSKHGKPHDLAMLEKKGVNLNARDHRPLQQPTALMKAIEGRNLTTFAHLLSRANPQILAATNEAGFNALDLARDTNAHLCKYALKRHYPSQPKKALWKSFLNHMTGLSV
ncbi:hypothetical protein [Vampirovibrio sp.]|uniref:hypothetical protein n=1 Tax=Vampirovibrio sp. TaxID=2717857 RepID=UPI003593516B